MPEQAASRVLRVAAATLSAVLLSLAFAPVEARWLSLLGLIPLLAAMRGVRARTGALLGFVFGIVFFGILLYWISYFGYAAWTALVLLQAAFSAAWGTLAARTSDRWGALGRVAAWPMLWAGVEMARARFPLGGFTWGGLGYTQAGGGALRHLAPLGGVYVVSLAVVAVNALISEVLCGRRRARMAVAAALIVLLPAVVPLGAHGRPLGSLDVAVVQGNVPRERFTGLGRRGRVGPEDFTIVENHLRVTRRLIGTRRPDLVVWPENSFDRDPRYWPEIFNPTKDLAREIGAPFLIGSILDVGERFTNSNLLLEPDGRIAARYDKMHLVPFGEYVPWRFARRLVPALNRELPVDGLTGRRPVVFRIGSARVGSVICFESTYPELARRLVAHGAQAVIVTTNDASFGTSPAAREHLSASRMRAIELGVPVAHAAISGISAIILPDGSIVRRAGLFRPALLRARLALSTGMTPYARYGAGIDIGMGAVALLAAAAPRRRRARS